MPRSQVSWAPQAWIPGIPPVLLLEQPLYLFLNLEGFPSIQSPAPRAKGQLDAQALVHEVRPHEARV